MLPPSTADMFTRDCWNTMRPSSLRIFNEVSLLLAGDTRRSILVAGRYKRYCRLVGPLRAIRCLIAEARDMGDLIPVDNTVLGKRLWLRLGSTDVLVAAKILHDREYELPFHRDPEIIVDAGAYTGISSLWFAARYPTATIVALEPDPSNFRILRLNVAGVSRIVPLQEALWSDDGSVRIVDPGDGAWGVRVVEGGSGNVTATSVPTLMRRFGFQRIDLLKLDIEGAEVELFEGDVRAWLGSVDAIAVETHERWRADARTTVMRACADFWARDIGRETVFLTRASGHGSIASLDGKVNADH